MGRANQTQLVSYAHSSRVFYFPFDGECFDPPLPPPPFVFEVGEAVMARGAAMSSSGERLSSLSLETYAAFALADELSSLVIVGAAVVAAAPCGEESQSRKASTELSDGERGIVGCGVGESGSDAMNWARSVWREEERWNRLEWLLMLSFIQGDSKKKFKMKSK